MWLFCITWGKKETYFKQTPSDTIKFGVKCPDNLSWMTERLHWHNASSICSFKSTSLFDLLKNAQMAQVNSYSSRIPTIILYAYLKNHSLQSKAEGWAEGVGVVGWWRPVENRNLILHNVFFAIKRLQLKCCVCELIKQILWPHTHGCGAVWPILLLLTCGARQVFPSGDPAIPEPDPTEGETKC